MASREESYEQIDGVTVVRIPLGKSGKGGYCVMDKEDWDSYLSRGYSPKIYFADRHVKTAQRSKATRKSSSVTVARIISRADKGQRVRFKNGDRRDLRNANLELIRGKGGARFGASTADPRKGRMQTEVQTLEQLDRFKQEIASSEMLVKKYRPSTDWSTIDSWEAVMKIPVDD